MDWIERHTSLLLGLVVGSLIWDLLVFVTHAGQRGC
jgi:hypothetical protein